MKTKQTKMKDEEFLGLWGFVLAHGASALEHLRLQGHCPSEELKTLVALYCYEMVSSSKEMYQRVWGVLHDSPAFGLQVLRYIPAIRNKWAKGADSSYCKMVLDVNAGFQPVEVVGYLSDKTFERRIRSISKAKLKELFKTLPADKLVLWDSLNIEI